jgi:hypothetical protein
MHSVLPLLRVGQPHIRHGKRVELIDGETRVPRTPWRLATGADHLDIRGTQATHPHTLRKDGGDLVTVQPRVEAPACAASQEAVQVDVQAEIGAIPDGHHIVGGVGTQKTPVGDRDCGLGDRQKLAAHECNAVCVCGFRGHGQNS